MDIDIRFKIKKLYKTFSLGIVGYKVEVIHKTSSYKREDQLLRETIQLLQTRLDIISSTSPRHTAFSASSVLQAESTPSPTHPCESTSLYKDTK